MRWTILLAMALMLSGTTAGQLTTTDSQGLEGIRVEIRQLRQDLRGLVGAAQRAQILIARVQIQEIATRQAQERIDAGRAKLTEVQNEERQLAYEVKRNEDLSAQADDPKKRKEAQEAMTRFRAELEERNSIEQQEQAILADAEQHLRAEQAKLGRLQDELDRLDKTLE